MLFFLLILYAKSDQSNSPELPIEPPQFFNLRSFSKDTYIQEQMDIKWPVSNDSIYDKIITDFHRLKYESTEGHYGPSGATCFGDLCYFLEANVSRQLSSYIPSLTSDKSVFQIENHIGFKHLLKINKSAICQEEDCSFFGVFWTFAHHHWGPMFSPPRRTSIDGVYILADPIIDIENMVGPSQVVIIDFNKTKDLIEIPLFSRYRPAVLHSNSTSFFYRIFYGGEVACDGALYPMLIIPKEDLRNTEGRIHSLVNVDYPGNKHKNDPATCSPFLAMSEQDLFWVHNFSVFLCLFFAIYTYIH